MKIDSKIQVQYEETKKTQKYESSTKKQKETRKIIAC